MQVSNNKTALVFDFHRGTLHDGPGMRTTVFFKGCPLSCKWCHNPESIAVKPSLMWDSKKCIGCKTCTNASKGNDIYFDDSGLNFPKLPSDEILEIAKLCPSKALTIVGQEYFMDELMKKALKDEMFFEEFGGGITFSGGEAMLQFDFIIEFAKKLKSKGIHLCLDTCGVTSWARLDAIFEYIDVFLYDLKVDDELEHIKYTGLSNKIIKENLKLLSEKVAQNPEKKIWIRTPLIPGYTATKSNIKSIGEFLNTFNIVKNIQRWELCSFNNICKQKYKKLSINWELSEAQLLDDDQLNTLKYLAEIYAPNKVSTSGLTSKK